MKKYDKQEQCHNLVKEMLKMFPGKQGDERLMKALVVDGLGSWV